MLSKKISGLMLDQEAGNFKEILNPFLTKIFRIENITGREN